MLFDFAETPAKERYKLLTSTIVPRPIAWVVTRDREGQPNAAPFSFFNVFATDPVVIGFSVGPRPAGSDKDTAANIRARGEFVVNLVSQETAEQMNITAIEFDTGVDEIKTAGLTTAPSSRIATPRIAESPVALECETYQLVPIGHHLLVLGRVLAMHVRDDCVLDAKRHYIDTAGLNLIGRMHAPNWYARTADSFEMPRISVAEWAEREAAGKTGG